nr:hypothetical protein [Flavobacterium sp. PL002]
MISPTNSGINIQGFEIKVNRIAVKHNVHSVIFNLLCTTNTPLIENSSIIGIITIKISSFSGVLKSFKSSASNIGLLNRRYVEIKKIMVITNRLKKRYTKSKVQSFFINLLLSFCMVIGFGVLIF